jgi:ATP-dependent RNA helicase SUPV3L1/SUV3
MGLAPDNFARLLRDAGFRPGEARKLAEGAFGPPAPPAWNWRPPRRDQARKSGEARSAPTGGAFAGLAELLG